MLTFKGNRSIYHVAMGHVKTTPYDYLCERHGIPANVLNEANEIDDVNSSLVIIPSC